MSYKEFQSWILLIFCGCLIGISGFSACIPKERKSKSKEKTETKENLTEPTQNKSSKEIFENITPPIIDEPVIRQAPSPIPPVSPGPITKQKPTPTGLKITDPRLEWFEQILTPGEYLQLSFTLDANHEIKRIPGIFQIKTTCLTAGEIDTRWLDPKVDLRSDTKELLPTTEIISFLLGTFPNNKPSECELEFFYLNMLPGGFTDYRHKKLIVRLCWADSQLQDGECPKIHKTAQQQAISLSGVTITPIKQDNGWVIQVLCAAQIGTDIQNRYPMVPDRITTEFLLDCSTCNKSADDQVPGFSAGSELISSFDPGDQIILKATGFITRPLENKPQRCNLTIKEKNLLDSPSTELGQWCMNRDKITSAPCEPKFLLLPLPGLPKLHIFPNL